MANLNCKNWGRCSNDMIMKHQLTFQIHENAQNKNDNKNTHNRNPHDDNIYLNINHENENRNTHNDNIHLNVTHKNENENNNDTHDLSLKTPHNPPFFFGGGGRGFWPTSSSSLY
jgi:hypothetical protein